MKIAFYSCAFSDYDFGANVKKFSSIAPFYIFTDNHFSINCYQKKGWLLPHLELKFQGSPFQKSRYYKFLGHKYLPPEYNYLIYLDANIIIKEEFLSFIVSLLREPYSIYFFRHPDCSTMKDEVIRAFKCNKITTQNLHDYIHPLNHFIYKYPGYLDFQITQNNMFVYDASDLFALDLLEKIYSYVSKFNIRDQFCSPPFTSAKSLSNKLLLIPSATFKKYTSLLPHKKHNIMDVYSRFLLFTYQNKYLFALLHFLRQLKKFFVEGK